MNGIEKWIDQCINGTAGLRTHIKYERLGVEPEDMAAEGAEWILRCLVQPHGKEALQAVNERAAELARLTP